MKKLIIFCLTLLVIGTALMFSGCAEEPPVELLLTGDTWQGTSIKDPGNLEPGSIESYTVELVFNEDGTGSFLTDDVPSPMSGVSYDPITKALAYTIHFGSDTYKSDLVITYDASLIDETRLFAFGYKRQGSGNGIEGTWEGNYLAETHSEDWEGNGLIYKYEEGSSTAVFSADGTYNLDTTYIVYEDEIETINISTHSVKDGEWQYDGTTFEMMDSAQTQFTTMDHILDGDYLAFGICYKKK